MMKLYATEVALTLAGLFYLLVLGLLWKFWKHLPSSLPIRPAVTIAVVLLAVAIPLWDVVVTSTQMANLCSNAGVFIKRSVQVDGYMGGWAEDLKRGFKYIEGPVSGERIELYYYQEPNRIQTLQHFASRYEPQSRYEFKNEANGMVVPGTRNIDMDRSVVRDRTTGEELGFAVRYHAYAGWLDRQTVARSGRVHWMCPTEAAQELRLVQEILLPK